MDEHLGVGTMYLCITGEQPPRLSAMGKALDSKEDEMIGQLMSGASVTRYPRINMIDT